MAIERGRTLPLATETAMAGTASVDAAFMLFQRCYRRRHALLAAGDNADTDLLISGRQRSIDGGVMDALEALDVLLSPGLLDKASAVLDKPQPVAEVVAKCGRRCHTVKGDKGRYAVFAGFCSCRNFMTRVELETPYCKHIVAVKLADAMQTIVRVDVEDAQFAQFLLQ